MNTSSWMALAAAVFPALACGPSVGFSDGPAFSAPVTTPARMADPQQKSCPSLQLLSPSAEGVTAVIAERTESTGSLGRYLLRDGAWSAPVTTALPSWHFVATSAAPSGEAFSTISTSDSIEPFEVLEAGGDSWRDAPFLEPLDRERQNFPTQLVALGEGRAAVLVWEANGRNPSRERTYLYESSTWQPVGDWEPGEDVRRGLLRGPNGALWSVVNEANLFGATARVFEWSGTEWVSRYGPLPVPSRLSVLKVLGDGPRGPTAIFQTENAGRYTLTESRLSDGARTNLADFGEGVEVADVDYDADQRPVVTLVQPSSEITEQLIQVGRKEGAGWTTLGAAQVPGALVAGPLTAITPDGFLVGWTESAEAIDVGFSEYSDCRLNLHRG